MIVAEPLAGCTSSASYQVCFGWVYCVTTPSAPPGDCDGDGRTDAADVDCFVGVLLGTDVDPDRVVRCDVNLDGLTDGDDVAPFLGHLIGG